MVAVMQRHIPFPPAFQGGEEEASNYLDHGCLATGQHLAGEGALGGLSAWERPLLAPQVERARITSGPQCWAVVSFRGERRGAGLGPVLHCTAVVRCRGTLSVQTQSKHRLCPCLPPPPPPTRPRLEPHQGFQPCLQLVREGPAPSRSNQNENWVSPAFP